MKLSPRIVRVLAWLVVVWSLALSACKGGVTHIGRAEDSADTAGEGDHSLAVPEIPARYVRVQRGAVELWYEPSVRDAVKTALDHLDEDARAIGSQLGLESIEPIRVRLVPDASEMRALAPVNAPPPTYAVGVAYPSIGLALVMSRAPGTWEAVDVRRVLRHELSHVLLAQAVGHAKVPRWFSEGMAIFQSGESNIERFRTLALASFAGRTIPLQDLDRAFADGGGRVDLAYAESADVVSTLLDREGPDRMHVFLRQLKSGATFEQALHNTWGIALAQLSDQWGRSARERFLLAPLWAGGGALWFVGAGLLVVAYVRRRKRARLTLERWEREERSADALAERRRQRLLEQLESQRLMPYAFEDDGTHPPRPVVVVNTIVTPTARVDANTNEASSATATSDAREGERASTNVNADSSADTNENASENTNTDTRTSSDASKTTSDAQSAKAVPSLRVLDLRLIQGGKREEETDAKTDRLRWN